MFKVKLPVALSVSVAALAVLATPAIAAFESTIGKSQGDVMTISQSIRFETVEGGPAVECKATNSEGIEIAKGTWQIQVKSTTQQGKFFYQAPTLKGPHEQLKIKWGICNGPTLLPAVVECNLQVESNGTNSSGTLSIYPPGCIVKLGSGENTCTINIQPDGNKELQGVTLLNEFGSGVKIAINAKGLSSTTQESKALCKTVGVKGGQKTGKLTATLVTLGQILIN